MTFEELHQILDDEERKLSPKELQQILYELDKDCNNLSMEHQGDKFYSRYYDGESNAFYIALKLTEHLEAK